MCRAAPAAKEEDFEELTAAKEEDFEGADDKAQPTFSTLHSACTPDTYMH
jgi:hypothetical protein